MMAFPRPCTSMSHYQFNAVLMRTFSTAEFHKTDDSSYRLREQLLRASFIHAKTLGFNDGCISAACKDFGYSSVIFYDDGINDVNS